MKIIIRKKAFPVIFPAVFAAAVLFQSSEIGAAAGMSGQDSRAASPNIIIVLGDDIGYGDFGCYGSTKIKTPNIDALAAGGMRFTDAYATASTCTPTRFALLTGSYAWRQRGTGIQSGVAPMLIKDATPTIASVAKQAGYTTGVVGKWHLGLGRAGPTDYNQELDAGPNTIGFDYSFIIPATGDRVPCVYVEDHKVVNYDPADPIRISYGKNDLDAPTWKSHPELVRPDHRDPVQEIRGGAIVNGICRIGFMTGGRTALWQDDAIADTLVGKANTFIKKNKDKPFLLYLATHDVHAPIAPNPRFLGTSGMGRRGVTVQQFDWCVGAVMQTLREQGLDRNTLVIVSSDNGGDGVYRDQEVQYGQKLNGPLRGYKSSGYEGGVREPLVAHWPDKIKAGSTNHQIVALVDCLATIAAITGQKIADNAGPDSFNILPTLLDPARPVRDHIITQGEVASHPACARAVRLGKWKLLTRKSNSKFKPELYDLEADLGETTNLAQEHPDIVQQLSAMLDTATEAGHTRNIP
jgi:arylsulfatase A-like enzyme